MFYAHLYLGPLRYECKDRIGNGGEDCGMKVNVLAEEREGRLARKRSMDINSYALLINRTHTLRMLVIMMEEQ